MTPALGHLTQSPGYVTPRPLAYRGKRDALVDRLSEAILRGELKMGQWLRQEEIAARFGVSPTPVREALRVLEAQGMVVYAPHRGVRVANFAGSVKQFYELRQALECLAVRMAVANLDEDRLARLWAAVADIERAGSQGDTELAHDAHQRFHLDLYSASGFPALVDMIQMVWSRFPWDVLLSLPERAPVSAEDQRLIAELGAAGEAEASAER
ncbi:MAG: GntR family transcriptional regulator, partial [Chloroflexota bacterium]